MSAECVKEKNITLASFLDNFVLESHRYMDGLNPWCLKQQRPGIDKLGERRKTPICHIIFPLRGWTMWGGDAIHVCKYFTTKIIQGVIDFSKDIMRADWWGFFFTFNFFNHNPMVAFYCVWNLQVVQFLLLSFLRVGQLLLLYELYNI